MCAAFSMEWINKIYSRNTQEYVSIFRVALLAATSGTDGGCVWRIVIHARLVKKLIRVEISTV
jgi:hypothetical protein